MLPYRLEPSGVGNLRRRLVCALGRAVPAFSTSVCLDAQSQIRNVEGLSFFLPSAATASLVEVSGFRV